MSPHEFTAIAELTDEIRGYRKDVAVLHTKVFGDPNNENDQGRLPRLEAGFASLHTRVRRQERYEWAARGAAFLIGAIIAVAGFFYDITNIHKGH